MGIPGFKVWFQEQHKQAYVPLSHVRVDYVYVDLNSVMHTALRSGKTREGFHKKMYQKLDLMLRVLRPKKGMMLAVDGPAPMAKVITQRKRRLAKGRKEALANKGLSSNALTPGTTFMLDVTLSLTHWVYRTLQTRAHQHLQFELSDCTVMGEGEVKILGRLARSWWGVQPEDTHIIVGDDADLILMACLAKPDHLYVCSTDRAHRLSDNLKVLSVDLLRDHWLKQALHSSHVELSMTDSAKVMGMKMDLSLMAILAQGNDYLPPMAIVTLNGLWKTYCGLRKSASQVGFFICQVDEKDRTPSIHLANLASLLPGIKSNTVKSGLPSSGPSSITTATGQDSCDLNASDDDDACDDDGDGQVVVEEVLEEEEELVLGSQQRPKEDRYLQGLLWVLHMYLRGVCPDYRYTYTTSSPSPGQFKSFLLNKAEMVEEVRLSDWGTIPASRKEPLPPLACAVALLPPSSANLLPDAARHLLTNNVSPLAALNAQCPTCDALRAKLREALSQRQAAQDYQEALARQLNAVQSKQEEAELKSALEDAAKEFKAKSEANRAAALAYNAHLKTHPPQVFPLQAVMTAVQELPRAAIPRAEQPLLGCRRSVALGLPQGVLERGYRVVSPPLPFTPTRVSTISTFNRVVSCEVHEPHEHDAPIHLQPAKAFVSQLRDALSSAPAEHARDPHDSDVAKKPKPQRVSHSQRNGGRNANDAQRRDPHPAKWVHKNGTEDFGTRRWKQDREEQARQPNAVKDASVGTVVGARPSGQLCSPPVRGPKQRPPMSPVARLLF